MTGHTKRLEKLDVDEVYAAIKLSGWEEAFSQLRKFEKLSIADGTAVELDKATAIIIANGDSRFKPKTEDALKETLSRDLGLSFNYLKETNKGIDTKKIAESVISQMFKTAKDKGLNLTQQSSKRPS